uniref:Uncharacterized protein n=1 Tax=Musca domestica TaxID=7370 RepID=A0A1I8N2N9_MUSDO
MVNMTYDIIFVYNSILAEVMKLQSSLMTVFVRCFNKAGPSTRDFLKFSNMSKPSVQVREI